MHLRTAAAVVLFLSGVVAEAQGLTSSPAAQIQLLRSVEAKSGTVLLGDVATIHTSDAGTIRRLLDVPLGSAPAGGSEKVLNRGTLQRWVRMQVGSLLEDVSWEGAEEVVVRGPRARSPLVAQASGGTALVPQGGWVAIHLRAGAVELEGRGRALQDGSLGEAVKVQPVGSMEPINARVVAPGHVEALL